jgi:ankyrin repeat protein
LKGHLNVVQLLLDHGADIHAQNDAALRWSVSNGHLDVVHLLLDHGADIHALNDDALCWSAQGGYLNIVKLFLKQKANKEVIKSSKLFDQLKKLKIACFIYYY